MIRTVRPVVAPAIPLFLALLSVLALGVVNVAQAQTVTLGLSSPSIAENGGTATVTATVSPASATAFTVDVSTVETADSHPSAGPCHGERNDTEFRGERDGEHRNGDNNGQRQ